MLPCHGKVNCQRCFNTAITPVDLSPNWQMRNDPGAWGTSHPEVLILGFSKGSTQANIYANGAFNDVAFGGQARKRLDQELKSIHLLEEHENVSSMIENENGRMAFGSLVRCSLTRADKNNKQSCSGALINKSFKEIPQILNNCVSEYLTDLPEETKLVVMLGVGDAYIKNCRQLFSAHSNIELINAVSYTVDGRLFVHLAHPSPGNGHFNSWVNGGQKQQLALQAIKQVMDI